MFIINVATVAVAYIVFRSLRFLLLAVLILAIIDLVVFCSLGRLQIEQKSSNTTQQEPNIPYAIELNEFNSTVTDRDLPSANRVKN